MEESKSKSKFSMGVLKSRIEKKVKGPKAPKNPNSKRKLNLSKLANPLKKLTSLKFTKQTGGSKFGKKLTFILVISILVPVILAGSILFVNYDAYINKDVEANNSVILDDVHKTIRMQLENVTSSLSILSKVDYVQKMQPFLVKSMFENVQQANLLLSNITVVDTAGKIKYSLKDEEGQLSSNYITKALNGEMNYSEVISFSSNAETKKVIMQAIPVLDKNGTVKGVLIGEISLNTLVKMVTEIELPDFTEVLIIGPDASLLAHSDQAIYDKSFKNKFSEYKPFKNAKLDVTFTEKADYKEIEYLMTYSRIPMLEWTIVAQIPTKNAYSDLTKVTYIFISIILVALVSGYIISKLIANYTTKPLSMISDVANLAKDGDFTHDVDTTLMKRNDEFGDLAVSFSTMMHSFKEVVSHLTTSTTVLDQSSVDLKEASSASTDVLSEIVEKAGHLSFTANEDIEHANEVVRSVSEMADGSENVAKNTDNLNMLIKNNVSFASTGVSMMAETSTLINKAVDSYSKIENNMTSLQKSALNIGGITDTIMNIAGQTNLLALNAAIEAARAGDAGRGFAVVANEIRNLADQSNKSAGNITHLISSIQQDIEHTTDLFNGASRILQQVVDESNKTMSQINDILQDSQKASLEIDEISAVTEEHAATSAHIDEKMNGMLATLLDTLKTANEMSSLIDLQNQRNEETVEKIESIKSVSEQFKGLIGMFKL